MIIMMMVTLMLILTMLVAANMMLLQPLKRKLKILSQLLKASPAIELSLIDLNNNYDDDRR
jgi:hypothetical protein